MSLNDKAAMRQICGDKFTPGLALKVLRAVHNLTREDLRDALGVNESAIARFENRRGILCYEDIKRLAAFFKIETSIFLQPWENED